MAGLADFLYLGQPDPARQIAQMLSGQSGGPAQGAGPTGANPPGPGGPAPNTPPPDAPPSPGNPPPNTPPQPQAYQSPPDMAAGYQQLASPQANNLMSLYLQMDARNRASDQINHGLALLAANYAGNPGSARAIMQSVEGRGDAAGMVGNLMQIYGFQQKQAGMQAMLQNADAYDQKLGLPPGTSRAMIMSGRGDELISQLEPTTETRNIQAEHDMFIKNAVTQGQDPKAAEADWQQNIFPFKIGGVGGDALTRSEHIERVRFQQNNPGEALPWQAGDPQSFSLWKTKQDGLVKDQEDAADKLHRGYAQNLTDLRNNLGNIVGLKQGGDADNPDDYDPAKQALLKSALSRVGAQGYLSGDPKEYMNQWMHGNIPEAEKRLLDSIRTASDPKSLYGTLGQRAPRRGQSDVSELNSGLGEMSNIQKSPEDFLSGVVKTIKATDKALGNGFGAAGEAENAPAYTKYAIDQSYLPGGTMYPYGKKQQPMSQDQVAFATSQMKGAQDKEAMRQKLIHLYLADNVDPTPLRNMKF